VILSVHGIKLKAVVDELNSQYPGFKLFTAAVYSLLVM